MELTATTKRRKLAERHYSIKTRLAKAKEELKEATVDERKQHRIEQKRKAGTEL